MFDRCKIKQKDQSILASISKCTFLLIWSSTARVIFGIFDILTPEDQIAANLTPINDICRVVHLDAPVNLAAHLADG